MPKELSPQEKRYAARCLVGMAVTLGTGVLTAVRDIQHRYGLEEEVQRAAVEALASTFGDSRSPDSILQDLRARIAD